MIIYMLAAAMTIAMLIATAFGLQDEAEERKLQTKAVRARGFGLNS